MAPGRQVQILQLANGIDGAVAVTRILRIVKKRVDRLVAFQVDEIRGPFDWESVVLKGGLYVVPADGATWEREAWTEGVEALRRLMPEVLTENDPAPQRSTVFRIAVQEVTGRAASTSG